MNTFFKGIIAFSLFLFVFAELAVRIFHLSIDAPKTYKNKNGNVNYYPNQEGYWDGGRHKWYINKLGYPGKQLPESFDNLVFIIGDSYIQNFMNPDSCRQKVYLRQLLPDKNFLEISQDGTNFLGYFEFSKPLDSLKPMLKIIYVNNKDFLGNIRNNENNKGNYQVDIETGKIFYPAYRGSKLKDFIYNFKFFYYLYRKNIKLFNPVEVEVNTASDNSKIRLDIDYNELESLTVFIKNNYDTKNVILVFHPNSDPHLIAFLKNADFNVMEIQKPEHENWKTAKDGHWNPEAHKKIAKQIAVFLNENSASIAVK